jgi:hypothetical protein
MQTDNIVGGSLPRAALGKTFAEHVCPFAERSKLSAKDWNPVVNVMWSCI